MKIGNGKQPAIHRHLAATGAGAEVGGSAHPEAPPGATLYQHWSAEPIENALACFAPRKAVPAFKLKQNGGKSELVRDAAIGPKYYGGWTAFVKAAVSFQGDFTFLTSPAEAPKSFW